MSRGQEVNKGGPPPPPPFLSILLLHSISDGKAPGEKEEREERESDTKDPPRQRRKFAPFDIAPLILLLDCGRPIVHRGRPASRSDSAPQLGVGGPPTFLFLDARRPIRLDHGLYTHSFLFRLGRSRREEAMDTALTNRERCRCESSTPPQQPRTKSAALYSLDTHRYIQRERKEGKTFFPVRYLFRFPPSPRLSSGTKTFLFL